jgi:hypothetical protein
MMREQKRREKGAIALRRVDKGGLALYRRVHGRAYI